MKPASPQAWLAFLALVVVQATSAEEPPRKPVAKTDYDATDNYIPREIEGWKVLVNKKLLAEDKKPLRKQTLKLLANHLYRITRVVPDAALAKLRKISIWVELAEPHHPCMCYHVSADWLREHGINSEKAGGVELANAVNFMHWTHEQPWMVLHELAHGYHHQVLTYEHPEVRACYERAVTSKSYDSVRHINGSKERAYALVNDEEYFAETSEAFFGTNDFYPFVRSELKEHEPKMYELLEKLWGGRKSGKE